MLLCENRAVQDSHKITHSLMANKRQTWKHRRWIRTGLSGQSSETARKISSSQWVLRRLGRRREEKKKFSQVSFFQNTNLSAAAKNCFLSSDTTADKTLSVHSHTCSGGFRLNHKVLSGTLYSLKLSVILKTFNSSVIYDNTMICFIRGRGRAGPALFFRGRQILIIAKIPAAQWAV